MSSYNLVKTFKADKCTLNLFSVWHLYLPFTLSLHSESEQKMLLLAEPEPPIKLEKMEETTNKISLALAIQEERTKPGRCFAAFHPIDGTSAHVTETSWHATHITVNYINVVLCGSRARGYQSMVWAVDNVEEWALKPESLTHSVLRMLMAAVVF